MRRTFSIVVNDFLIFYECMHLHMHVHAPTQACTYARTYTYNVLISWLLNVQAILKTCLKDGSDTIVRAETEVADQTDSRTLSHFNGSELSSRLMIGKGGRRGGGVHVAYFLSTLFQCHPNFFRSHT